MSNYVLTETEKEILSASPYIKKIDLDKFILLNGSPMPMQKFYAYHIFRNKLSISYDDLAVVMLNIFIDFIKGGVEPEYNLHIGGLQFILDFFEIFLNSDLSFDENIKKEIFNIYDKFKEKFAQFCDPHINGNDYVYMTTLYDVEEDFMAPYFHYFPTVSDAYEYIKNNFIKDVTEYSIQKVKCIDMESFTKEYNKKKGSKIETDESVKERNIMEEFIEYDKDDYSYEFITVFINGKVDERYIGISCSDIEQFEEIYDSVSESVKNRFVNIPHPFTDGKIVYGYMEKTNENDEVPLYIVKNGFEEEKDIIKWFNESYINNMKEKNLKYEDSFVRAIQIGYLRRDGKFRFSLDNCYVGLNPFYLKEIDKDRFNIKGNIIKNLINYINKGDD